MSRRKPTHMPWVTPVSCWLLTASLVSLSVGCFLWAVARFDVPASAAFAAFNEARLADLSATKRDSTARVVMLGNSRLKYATLTDDDLMRRAGAGTAIVRIVNNWAIFTDFEPLLESILQTAPTLIVLQEDLLGDGWSFLNKLRHARQYVRWKLFGAGAWNPGVIDQRALQFDTPCSGEVSERAVEQRLARTELWLVHDSDGVAAAAAYRFIERALSAGTDVVVLSIPRSGPMEAARPVTLLDDPPEALRRAGVDVWRYTDPLADDYFCDTIHINAEGRERFSRWLLDNLGG